MVVLIVLGGVVIAVLLGWPVTAGTLALARTSRDTVGRATTRLKNEPELNSSATASDADGDAAEGKSAIPGPDDSSVLRGGTIIGMLERAGVVLCIAFDQPTAIAFIIAVKGLGRYPELKQTPAASERFIIGSLASLTFAAAVGIIARWLLRLL